MATADEEPITLEERTIFACCTNLAGLEYFLPNRKPSSIMAFTVYTTDTTLGTYIIFGKSTLY